MTEQLKLTLSNAVKDAMRAKQSERLGTLRLLQAAIKQKEVDERKELNDSEIVAIIEKQIKQRKESIIAYEKGGRTDTAAAEKAEMDVLSEFLPAQATAEEIKNVITQTLDQLKAEGISGGPAMGKAMSIIKAKLAGRADMAEISKQIKAAIAIA